MEFGNKTDQIMNNLGARLNHLDKKRKFFQKNQFELTAPSVYK